MKHLHPARLIDVSQRIDGIDPSEYDPFNVPIGALLENVHRRAVALRDAAIHDRHRRQARDWFLDVYRGGPFMGADGIPAAVIKCSGGNRGESIQAVRREARRGVTAASTEAVFGRQMRDRCVRKRKRLRAEIPEAVEKSFPGLVVPYPSLGLMPENLERYDKRRPTSRTLFTVLSEASKLQSQSRAVADAARDEIYRLLEPWMDSLPGKGLDEVEFADGYSLWLFQKRFDSAALRRLVTDDQYEAAKVDITGPYTEVTTKVPVPAGTREKIIQRGNGLFQRLRYVCVCEGPECNGECEHDGELLEIEAD